MQSPLSVCCLAWTCQSHRSYIISNRRCHAAQVKQHAYENMDGLKKKEGEKVKDQLAKVKALCFILVIETINGLTSTLIVVIKIG